MLQIKPQNYVLPHSLALKLSFSSCSRVAIYQSQCSKSVSVSCLKTTVWSRKFRRVLFAEQSVVATVNVDHQRLSFSFKIRCKTHRQQDAVHEVGIYLLQPSQSIYIAQNTSWKDQCRLCTGHISCQHVLISHDGQEDDWNYHSNDSQMLQNCFTFWHECCTSDHDQSGSHTYISEEFSNVQSSPYCIDK